MSTNLDLGTTGRLAVKPAPRAELLDSIPSVESARNACYPLSRWYLRPLAGFVAARLIGTRVQPVHFTLANLACGLLAAAVLVLWPVRCDVAAALVMLGWFCDRLDGRLARAQGTASAWGAWLDGNIDELVDIVLHAALAFAAASILGSNVAWWCFVLFLVGKYLFMHGLNAPAGVGHWGTAPMMRAENHTGRRRWIPALYHLPGNADVRVHLLAAGLYAGSYSASWLAIELTMVALYYNVRWIARYAIVYQRLR